MREHLDIGRVFSAIADLYRNHVGSLLVPAFVIFLVTALIVAALAVISPFAVLLSLPVAFVGQYWYQGMVIELVNRVHAGAGIPGTGELFSSVGPRLGRLIGAGILAGLGIALGLVLLIVPGLYLITIWAVIAPVIVIEGSAIGAAFGRSQQLVKGDGWQVFGVLVLLFVVSFVISLVLGVIFGSESFIGAFLGSFIPSLLLQPITALAAAVVYFELRRLKEGAAVAGGPGSAGVGPGQPPYPGGQPGYGQQPEYPQPQGASPAPSYPPPPGPSPGG